MKCVNEQIGQTKKKYKLNYNIDYTLIHVAILVRSRMFTKYKEKDKEFTIVEWYTLYM